MRCHSLTTFLLRGTHPTSLVFRELEESAGGAVAFKDTITELALRYGLVSTFTSFVATADGDQAIEGTMRQVQVNDALLHRRASGSLPPTIPEELDEIAESSTI